jgi:hypothetical protein
MQVRIRTQQLAVPWNPENRQAFEQYGGNRWMLPVEVIGDYTTEGFFHKFNGVQNISSMVSRFFLFFCFFRFDVCFALFIDLLTDKVQPLSRP